VAFEYAVGRSSDVPVKFLRGYSGRLQTDDYETYHTALARLREPLDPGGGIRHVLCWAHVRRYFVRAWETTRSEDAKNAIDKIGELFQLEDLRGKYSAQGFHKHRKREAESILRELKPWMQYLYAEVPPKGVMGKSLLYAPEQLGTPSPSCGRSKKPAVRGYPGRGAILDGSLQPYRVGQIE
jgi:hypothetical protein